PADERRGASVRPACDDIETRLPAVHVEIGVAQHLAAVGADVGKVAWRQALDFGDEPAVAHALLDTISCVLHEIRDHGLALCLSVLRRIPVDLPERLEFWHSLCALQHGLLQCTNASRA